MAALQTYQRTPLTAKVNAGALSDLLKQKAQHSQIIFLSQGKFNFEDIQAAPSIFGVNLLL